MLMYAKGLATHIPWARWNSLRGWRGEEVRELFKVVLSRGSSFVQHATSADRESCSVAKQGESSSDIVFLEGENAVAFVFGESWLGEGELRCC